jgi:hypothetical protein
MKIVSGSTPYRVDKPMTMPYFFSLLLFFGQLLLSRRHAIRLFDACYIFGSVFPRHKPGEGRDRFLEILIPALLQRKRIYFYYTSKRRKKSFPFFLTILVAGPASPNAFIIEQVYAGGASI